MDIWKKNTRQVFLASFKDTPMEDDVDNINSFINDYFRTKTYTKDDDKCKYLHDRIFSEPYNVAHYYCGFKENTTDYNKGDINAFNTPFLIQVGLCNLNCYYCFVSKELRTANEKFGSWFSAKEVVDWFVKYKNGIGILRISGGEPFLAPEFLIDVAQEIKNRKLIHCYLYLDTNLCSPADNYKIVITEINKLGIPYAICGCIKGVDDQDFEFNTGTKSRLDEQYSNLHLIYKRMYRDGGLGQLFVYLAEITENRDLADAYESLFCTFKRLELLHKNLPLRTTILKIKTYNANENNMSNKQNASFKTGITKNMWRTIIENNYSIKDQWLPQYQVSLN